MSSLGGVTVDNAEDNLGQSNMKAVKLNLSHASDTSTPDLYPRQPNSDAPVRLKLAEDAAPTRYRGNRDGDISTWDDEAANRLRSTYRSPGDYFDCLALCRKSRFHIPLTTVQRQFGVIWFVRDCCGIVCIVITWLLILYAEFVVSFVILMQSPSKIFCWTSGIIYHLFATMAVVAHYKAFSSDPGCVPIGTATQAAVKYLERISEGSPLHIVRCLKCLCIKPPRAHHCRVCNRCIQKMDHHCPWVNNCVGEGNQKYFVLFTLYICLMSFYAIYMSTHFIIQCIGSEWDKCQIPNDATGFAALAPNFSPLASSVFILCLVCESLLFGIFTMVMCISQMCSISNDETGIESVKKEQPSWEPQSRRRNFRKVFGSPISWRWLSPFSPSPSLSTFLPPLPELYDSEWSSNRVNNDPDLISHMETDGDVRNAEYIV